MIVAHGDLLNVRLKVDPVKSLTLLEVCGSLATLLATHRKVTLGAEECPVHQSGNDQISRQTRDSALHPPGAFQALSPGLGVGREEERDVDKDQVTCSNVSHSNHVSSLLLTLVDCKHRAALRHISRRVNFYFTKCRNSS